MKYNSMNFYKTTIIDGLILPDEIWIYGGFYVLQKDDINYFYKFILSDEKAYEKFHKVNKLKPTISFQDFKYKELINGKTLIKCIKKGKNTAILGQYKIAIEKEKNKKFDCYKNSFDNKNSDREIESKFKNLPYIKPYYQILKILDEENIKKNNSKGEICEK